jgi:hypothetical protein
MKLWQKRIETDEQLAARAVEIEALRAEVKTQIAERTHKAVSSRGGSAERATGRPWMKTALPIVEERDLGGADIIQALRQHWEEHPELKKDSPLPGHDAIVKWSQRIGRPHIRNAGVE